MNLFKKSLCSLILGGILFSGCVNMPMARNPREAKKVSEELREEITEKYFLPEYFGIRNIAVRKATGRYAIRDLELTCRLGEAERKIELSYFDLYEQRKKPLIVMLPITGGGKYKAEDIFASYFADKGMAVALIHRPKISEEIKDFSDVDRLLVQGVVDVRQVIDYFSQQEDIDESKIGGFGISLGAMRMVLAKAYEPRIGPIVVALGGSPLAEVIGHTNLKGGFARTRAGILEKSRMTLEEGIEALRKENKHELGRLAESIKTENVYCVLACWDKTVPYKNGKKLREELGKPKTSFLLGNHYSSLIYIPCLKWSSSHFFMERFKEHNGRE